MGEEKTWNVANAATESVKGKEWRDECGPYDCGVDARLSVIRERCDGRGMRAMFPV